MCAGLSSCYVAATNLVASLGACLDSFGRGGPNKGPSEAPNNRLCHVEGGHTGAINPSTPLATGL